MTSIETFKAIYAHIPPARQRQIVRFAIIMGVVSCSELALAGVISLLGVALSSPEQIQHLPVVGYYLEKLASLLSAPPVIGMLVLILMLVSIATLAKNIGTGYITYKQQHIAQTVAWDIRTRIFHNYLYAPYIWHSKQNTAKLQSYLLWGAHVSSFFLYSLTTLTQICIATVLLLGAFITAPVASILLFGVCGSMAVVIYKLTQQKAHYLGKLNSELDIQNEKTSHFALQGMREVQIYNQRKAFDQEYASFAQPKANISSKQCIYPGLPQWILETLGMVILLGIVLLLWKQDKSVANITGTLTLMAGVAWRLLPTMNKLMGSILSIKNSLAPTQELITNLTNIPKANLALEAHGFTQNIVLDSISFSYEQSPKKILEDISLTINRGSMIGLVGLSGAGKSTLVSILTGLLSPTHGQILIDNTPVIAKTGYLNIGYVPQHPYMMDATLAQNIAFCDWGKEIDENRVVECCKLAAMDFLKDLPEGIHTMLGDRGMRLSGGQAQRVAIARALYSNPDILLFDEATSALDGATEAEIQKTILTLRQKLTIVMVAHRLSTVEGCDSVYWLHEGKLQNMHDNEEKALEQYKKFLKDNITKKQDSDILDS